MIFCLIGIYGKLFISIILHHLRIHCWAEFYTLHLKISNFALWLFAKVKTCQVKFRFSKDNQPKSTPKDITKKYILHVMQCGLWIFNLIARDNLTYRFCWHNTYSTSFLKQNRTNFFLFLKKRNTENLFSYFCWDKLITKFVRLQTIFHHIFWSYNLIIFLKFLNCYLPKISE